MRLLFDHGTLVLAKAPEVQTAFQAYFGILALRSAGPQSGAFASGAPR
jgi:hypothetical protein